MVDVISCCKHLHLVSFPLIFVSSSSILAFWIFYMAMIWWSIIFLLQLATHKNGLGVAVGATFGHTLCTSLAVVGGSMLASKISQRTVATVGGLLFLGFSLSSYFYPPLWVSDGASHQSNIFKVHSIPSFLPFTRSFLHNCPCHKKAWP